MIIELEDKKKKEVPHLGDVAHLLKGINFIDYSINAHPFAGKVCLYHLH